MKEEKKKRKKEDTCISNTSIDVRGYTCTFSVRLHCFASSTWYRRYDIRVYRPDPHIKQPLYGNALVNVNYSYH